MKGRSLKVVAQNAKQKSMEKIDSDPILKNLLLFFNAEAKRYFPNKKITVMFKEYKLYIYGRTIRKRPDTYLILLRKNLAPIFDFKQTKAKWFFTLLHELGHIANGHFDSTYEELELAREFKSEIGLGGMLGFYDTEEEKLDIRRARRNFIRKREKLQSVRLKESVADSWARKRLPKLISKYADTKGLAEKGG